MLTSAAAFQTAHHFLARTPLGREILAFNYKLPARPWVMPMRGPYAGEWWLGVLIFPKQFRELPAEVTGPWLAHEIVHLVQSSVRGTRTPLTGTLYREVEAEVVRYALVFEAARMRGDVATQQWAQSCLREVTSALPHAYAFIQRVPVYRTLLYRCHEAQAELMGWRRTLPRLGFDPQLLDLVDEILVWQAANASYR